MLQHPTASLLPLGALVWAVQCPQDSWCPAGLGVGWAEMGDVTPVSSKLRYPLFPMPRAHPSSALPPAITTGQEEMNPRLVPNPQAHGFCCSLWWLPVSLLVAEVCVPCQHHCGVEEDNPTSPSSALWNYFQSQ